MEMEGLPRASVKVRFQSGVGRMLARWRAVCRSGFTDQDIWAR